MLLRTLYLPVAGLVLLSLATPSLKAAEYRFGLEAGLALPTSDLKDMVNNNAGAGLGAHLLIDLGDGQVLRPRVEGWAFKSNDYTIGNFLGSVTGTQTVTQATAGLDYLYFLEANSNRGVYVLGGIGSSTNRIEINLDLNTVFGSTSVNSLNKTTTSFYYTLGGGYQFNRRWGMEARYSATHADYFNGSSTSLGSFNVLASFRF